MHLYKIFFFFLVDFNDFGVAEGKIDTAQVGPIAAVRLVIKSASKNWIIISEVFSELLTSVDFQ